MILRLLLIFTFIPVFAADFFYGRKTLEDLAKFGVEVRVQTTDDLKRHERTFQEHITSRLERRGIKIVESSSAILKLSIHSISSDDGYHVAYISLQLHQTAYLARNNNPIEAPTWDSWKMGEYRERDILKEVDDLSRLFTNDYLYGN